MHIIKKVKCTKHPIALNDFILQDARFHNKVVIIRWGIKLQFKNNKIDINF